MVWHGHCARNADLRLGCRWSCAHHEPFSTQCAQAFLAYSWSESLPLLKQLGFSVPSASWSESLPLSTLLHFSAPSQLRPHAKLESGNAIGANRRTVAMRRCDESHAPVELTYQHV